MKRPRRLLSILPLLFSEGQSTYLRDKTKSTVVDAALRGTGNAGWTRKGHERDGRNKSTSSVRRFLSQKESYEYHACSADIVSFESVVFIEFNNDLSNLTDSQRQALEQGFLSTYNDLNELYCDLSYHRSIVNVTLEWPPKRRRLREAWSDPFTIIVSDGANATDPIVDENQYAEDYQIIGEDGVLVTEKPRPGYVDIARFFINVECRNCPVETSLFSIVDPITEEPTPSGHGTVLSLVKDRSTGFESEYEALTDTCTCLEKKDFTAPLRAPTAAEFQISFNQTVETLHMEGVLQRLDEVEELVEVDVVKCDSKKKKFSSNIIADLEGSVELMTPEERRALEQSFLETYNSLTFARCDRYFRQILEVKLISSQDRRALLEEQWDYDDDDAVAMTTNSSYATGNSSFPFVNGTAASNSTKTNSTRSTPAVYRVLAECRGCMISRSGSFELFDDVFRRSLTQHWLVPPPPVSHYSRSLLEGTSDVCLCAANTEPSDPKAPTDQEFQKEYSQKVEKLQQEGVIVHVEAVENVTDDENVCLEDLLEETTNYIISFDREFERRFVEKKLTEAFRRSYRTFNRGKCGPLLSDVEVIEDDDLSLGIIFEVVSLQTYNGSIFFDINEEERFLYEFNELLEDERFEAKAEYIEVQAEPSTSPSLTPTQTMAPTLAPVIDNSTALRTSQGPTLAPIPTLPTLSSGPPVTAVPSAIVTRTTGPTAPVPTGGTTNTSIPRRTVPPVLPSTGPPTNPTEGSGPQLNIPLPPSSNPPTGAPTRSQQEKIGIPTAAAPTLAPTFPPTSGVEKIIRDVDGAVSEIIQDVGDTIETILGTVFPNESDLPSFLDAVDESIEKILGYDVDLGQETSGLLAHVSEKIGELSRIPWLPQLPDTYNQIQSSIGGLLAVLAPKSPTPSPSEVRAEQPSSTLSPTTEQQKKIDEAGAVISEIVKDVGDTLGKIVGHTVETAQNIPDFLDSVDNVLGVLASQPLPNNPELPAQLEHVSEKVDDISILPYIPDLPVRSGKIRETIRGFLGILRSSQSPTTDRPTDIPIQLPTTMPTSDSRPTSLTEDTGPNRSTVAPTIKATETASASPIEAPTALPTNGPTNPPTIQPTSQPTISPTNCGKSAKGKKSKGKECSQANNSKDAGSWIETALDYLWGDNDETPASESEANGQTQGPATEINDEASEPTSEPADETPGRPTTPPTFAPTIAPSIQPSPEPSSSASAPIVTPSSEPSLSTAAPTIRPSPEPSISTIAPTIKPSVEPSLTTSVPSSKPSLEPTMSTMAPTIRPSLEPTMSTTAPTSEPSSEPTMSTGAPTIGPSSEPTMSTMAPTTRPSLEPTMSTMAPTSRPSLEPTMSTTAPTIRPSSEPSPQTPVPDIDLSP